DGAPRRAVADPGGRPLSGPRLPAARPIRPAGAVRSDARAGAGAAARADRAGRDVRHLRARAADQGAGADRLRRRGVEAGLNRRVNPRAARSGRRSVTSVRAPTRVPVTMAPVADPRAPPPPARWGAPTPPAPPPG